MWWILLYIFGGLVGLYLLVALIIAIWMVWGDTFGDNYDGPSFVKLIMNFMVALAWGPIFIDWLKTK